MMYFLFQILFWGLIIGIIHYFIMGILFQNPWVMKVYIDAQEKYPSVKMRKNTSDYLRKQFIGTQIEIWIITAGYLFLKDYLPFEKLENAMMIALIFAGIRIYERFWNMYIQTTYPKKLLAIEFVNGIIGTFIIVLGLSFLPIN